MRIAIKNISKVFKDGTHALTNVNLVIENGIFGLLGPNASGKTTLIRILATLLKPTKGMVTVDDMDLQKNRAAIRSMTGYLPQRFSMFTNLKTWEFLDYSARLAGLSDNRTRKKAVDEMLESLGLFEVRNRSANEISVVMKRHLEIAQAVIGSPRILIVDEPTRGLSPEERLRFRNLLADHSDKIKIIILSTHIHSDITSKCTDLAILEKGEVAYHGSPDILFEQAKGRKNM
ncbi:MAG TPA: ATP-binding cassette domain-containing protein [bacterium]|nr:ATP-binding cassette domain-containing protein [bacterium]